jgi:hypothetical protein
MLVEVTSGEGAAISFDGQQRADASRTTGGEATPDAARASTRLARS